MHDRKSLNAKARVFASIFTASLIEFPNEIVSARNADP
jgi:hypothetical protein